MKTHNENTVELNKGWKTRHSITVEDKTVLAAMRTVVAPLKGKLQGTAARGPFDGIMGRVLPPEGVSYEADTIGGVAGWWCRVAGSRPGQVMVHLHGGWFNWGTAQAYRHLVGQIATRAGVDAFIPDYRLAPEHPFPAAVDDVQACYQGLVDRGFRRIAVVGDSAGWLPGAGSFLNHGRQRVCRSGDSGGSGGLVAGDGPIAGGRKLGNASHG